MRFFWYALIAIGTLAAIIFVFFAFSLNANHRITFHGDTTVRTEPTVTIADPSIGPLDAPVTIVNFGDYQCTSCAEIDTALTDVIALFPGSIRLVWKDMPNTSTHPEALNAAIAARCAGEQKMFFEYHAYLFANQSRLSEEVYTSIAEELGLRMNAFTRCVENQETLALVEKSYEEGIALQIAATPTIFINGQRFTGVLTKAALESAIRTALASAP